MRQWTWAPRAGRSRIRGIYSKDLVTISPHSGHVLVSLARFSSFVFLVWLQHPAPAFELRVVEVDAACRQDGTQIFGHQILIQHQAKKCLWSTSGCYRFLPQCLLSSSFSSWFRKQVSGERQANDRLEKLRRTKLMTDCSEASGGTCMPKITNYPPSEILHWSYVKLLLSLYLSWILHSEVKPISAVTSARNTFTQKHTAPAELVLSVQNMQLKLLRQNTKSTMRKSGTRHAGNTQTAHWQREVTRLNENLGRGR